MSKIIFYDPAQPVFSKAPINCPLSMNPLASRYPMPLTQKGYYIFVEGKAQIEKAFDKSLLLHLMWMSDSHYVWMQCAVHPTSHFAPWTKTDVVKAAKEIALRKEYVDSDCRFFAVNAKNGEIAFEIPIKKGDAKNADIQRKTGRKV